MNPRLRRLGADYDDIVRAFAGHPAITVTPVGVVPPDRYQVLYQVPALVTNANNEFELRHQHLVNISLPAGYPREKPYCTCDSPVFHPNFGNYICIADFWSPAQSIVDVIVQIGDMLQFKLYNTRSPLNAVAARWASENIESLPIGNLDMFPIEPEIQLSHREQP